LRCDLVAFDDAIVRELARVVPPPASFVAPCTILDNLGMEVGTVSIDGG
jgi:hypothetical protein